MDQNLMHTYKRLPVDFVRALGTRLWDREGRMYLDAVAGVGVTAVGHSHPDVVATITDQANHLLHTSNLYTNRWQAELAARLCAISGMQNVFFGNSGAEANEAALKLARLHAHRRGIEQPLVVVMENAFHGRTFATLSASGSASVHAGFAPLVEGFVRVPFNDVAALEAIAELHGERLVAVLVEPVQGEAGVVPAAAGYLSALRQFCDQYACLLMLDEVQTGVGRTGKWFAYQHDAVQPDVVTMAKGLANGIPIGACLAYGDAATLFEPGNHGSTFGGNPFACRVACAVLDVIENAGLLANAARQGQTLLAGLSDTLMGREDLRSSGGSGGNTGNHHIRQIRGKGLMIGIEMDQPCAWAAADALYKHGLLINVTRGNTIRLLPPLVLSDGDTQNIIATLGTLLEAKSEAFA